MKLWNGRFTKNTDPDMDAFHTSLPFDARLWREDIRGSLAHAQMLGEQGIIKKEDAEAICSGLLALQEKLAAGTVTLAGEDIHMALEEQLTKDIGEAGKRLHTARSRNDQVAVDLRLYLRGESANLQEALCGLCELLCELGKKHLHSYMAGYTHLQKAQPVTLAHWLMAYYQMFSRDIARLQDGMKRLNVCPLGAGALAGTTHPINREKTAALLGFPKLCENSMDAVSDRDFCVELAAACSLIMAHLSRFCEELILWSSQEFAYVEMDEGFATGSSIMPQKKNPDAAELVRGKTGRVYGDLVTLLTVIKGLPLAYNKDLQEDKEAIFDSTDTTLACLKVFTKMLATCRFNTKRLEEAALHGFTNATDAADYLVKKGMPFRAAHETVGHLVHACLAQKKALTELTLAEWMEACPLFTQDIFEAISLRACVEKRATVGGPAPDAVIAGLEGARVFLAGARFALKALREAE